MTNAASSVKSQKLLPEHDIFLLLGYRQQLSVDDQLGAKANYTSFAQLGVVQKVTFLGNTDHLNFGWFTYDSTDGHPKKCYQILNHTRIGDNPTGC